MLPYRLVKCTFTGYLVTLYVTSLLFFVTQSCHEVRSKRPFCLKFCFRKTKSSFALLFCCKENHFPYVIALIFQIRFHQTIKDFSCQGHVYADGAHFDEYILTSIHIPVQKIIYHRIDENSQKFSFSLSGTSISTFNTIQELYLIYHPNVLAFQTL